MGLCLTGMPLFLKLPYMWKSASVYGTPVGGRADQKGSRCVSVRGTEQSGSGDDSALNPKP